MGKNRRPSANKPVTAPARYPKGAPADRPPQKRTAAQQARLWIVSLCGAVPGAVVVYLTNDYWVGAWVFLAIVIVLGFAIFLYEKLKKRS